MSTRRPWTDAERAVLRELYADTPTAVIAARLGRSVGTVFTAAYNLGLRKSDTYFEAGHGARLTGERGRSTRFKAGQPSWNKGTRFVAGGRSAETRFKPGQKSHTWRPVGSYRIRDDGYLEQKVSDTGYTPRDWRTVHRLVWEAVHGPTPAGHLVVFKPGRRTADPAHITLDAVELVSRQELMARNTIHRYPAELKQNIKLLARVKKLLDKKEPTR